MDTFEVLQPGPLTTVQDLGRYGYQQYGVPPSGAIDDYAFRISNHLVGNEETLEGRAVFSFDILLLPCAGHEARLFHKFSNRRVNQAKLFVESRGNDGLRDFDRNSKGSPMDQEVGVRDPSFVCR